MPTKSEIVDFLAREFPQSKCVVLEADHNTATITHRVGTDELRPGGTVSGPVLMTVADVALYVAVLATIGIVPLAVTTSLTINFLRKPSPARDIVGKCRLIKVGRTLAVGEVALYSQGEEAMVARSDQPDNQFPEKTLARQGHRRQVQAHQGGPHAGRRRSCAIFARRGSHGG